MKKYLFLSLILAIMACSNKKNADFIFKNGKIYTVDRKFSIVSALAVKDGKIIAIGNDSTILQNFSVDKIIDLQNKYMYPGFYDAHCHFYGYGTNLIKRADLSGTKSFAQILQILQNFNKKHPENECLEGRGWDQNDWEIQKFPNKSKLDSLFPDKPVFLIRIDGHAALCNSKALDKAGITAQTTIEGGKIDVKKGQLTGILIDNAVDLVYKVIPKPNIKMQTKALLEAQDSCFSVGLTTVDDAGLDYPVIKLIDSLQKSGKLKMQIYAMLSPSKENFDHFLRKGHYITNRLNIRSVKMYADGALGSRGAWLKKPYTDDPTNSGLQLTKDKVFDSICNLCYKYNYQVNTHAIGDSAVSWVLEYYHKYLRGVNDRRWRIEHSQIVDSSDMKKYNYINVIPSVQPTHATSDMYWAEERLGKARMKGAYAYQDLLRQNGWLADGSDFPIESINPLLGFYAAVARQDLKGWPTKGFQPENALNRRQALQAMTIWAAKSNFENGYKGSLKIGKQADFVILDTDIMECPIAKVPKAKVLSTYIKGEKVY